MKNLSKITLTIEFGKCSDKTKSDILSAISDDIPMIDNTTKIGHTFNYMNGEESISHIIDFKD